MPAREWMRICFELLEMLKAHKKGIRRATVNTFGYIAKAIGPQDVLVTLLNNLKVQERQNRVCTTVAIAIVAETCSPFTVLPALMNEYKVRIAFTQTMCQASVTCLQRIACDSWHTTASLAEVQQNNERRCVMREKLDLFTLLWCCTKYFRYDVFNG